MIGLISGDIIASPFNKVPVEGYSNIFFPIFSPVEKVTVNEEKRRASSRTYEPSMTRSSEVALAASRWFMELDDGADVSFRDYLSGDGSVSSLQLLSACAPIVEMSTNLGEARFFVDRIFSEMKFSETLNAQAAALTTLLWRAKNGETLQGANLEAFLRQNNLPVIMSASELRPFLEGTVAFGERPGVLVPGDGKRSVDPAMYITAAAVALSQGESWEECVRRGVAMGGEATVTASLVGALAELRYKEVPESITYRTDSYLNDLQRSYINSMRRYIQAPEESKSKSVEVINGRMVSVIRMEGMRSVYGVKASDTQMLEAIEASHRTLGTEYRIVDPSDLRDVFDEYNRQVDVDGNELNGVFVENPRPEIRTLWLQEGRLVSSTTRKGVRLVNNVERDLPSLEVRRRVFSEFQEFKNQVNAIRTEMEKRVQYDASEYGGRHLSFPSARYPVVHDSYVEVFENGTLRGRCGLNADGLFSVDINGVEYTFHGEGIEGVLNTQEFFKKGYNMSQCLAALNYFCLDVGIVPDEEEAKHLADNDEEAVAIRKKYGSNFDKVVKDMGTFDTKNEFMAALNKFDEMQGTSLSKTVTGEKSLMEAIDAGNAALYAEFSIMVNRKKVPLDGEAIFNLRTKFNSCENNSAIRVDGTVDRKAALVKDTLKGLYFNGKKATYEDVIRLFERVDAFRNLTMLHLLPEAVLPEEGTFSEEELQGKEERRQRSEADYAKRGITDFYSFKDAEAHKGSIFTIGHSSLPVEDFVRNLKRHGIKVVCDVRSYTNSKYAPQYKAETLAQTLEKYGIEYEPFPLLGEHQKKYSGKKAPEYSYSELMNRDSFRKEIDCLRENAADGLRLALLGREGNAIDSHRALLIGRALAHPELVHPKEVKAEEEKQAKLQASVDKAREQLSKCKTEEETAKAQAKLDKALKSLDNFSAKRKYAPVDVQHIGLKGGLVSQDKVEERLLELYGTEKGESKGTDKNILDKAYAEAEKSVKRKDSPTKQVYRRLMETSRMKKVAEARKIGK